MPAAAETADDRRAFRALYREHFAYVWRVLVRFGVPTAHLEDAVQEVFVVALRRPGAWREHLSPRAWLYGVARRVASTQRRSQHRHVRKLQALPRESASEGIEERVEGRRRLASLAAALDGLTPQRREVFVLAELEQLSAPEIAEALGCKLNTVYSRLRRARAEVRRQLEASEQMRESGDPDRARSESQAPEAGMHGPGGQPGSQPLTSAMFDAESSPRDRGVGHRPATQARAEGEHD